MAKWAMEAISARESEKLRASNWENRLTEGTQRAGWRGARGEGVNAGGLEARFWVSEKNPVPTRGNDRRSINMCGNLKQRVSVFFKRIKVLKKRDHV